ncbi:MAG: asparagine synthase, partial [Gammaproteobacteria bacterium]|nr:asparagine synthase [Gammaproteobacteria bacterium]
VALEVMAPVAGSVRDVVPRTIFRNVFANHHDQLSRSEDYINHSLYFEAKTFLHGLLVVEDKLSMAHSLESRVPFLDNDLVDFAGRLPVSMKLGNLGEVVRLNENEPGDKTRKYFEKTQDGKRALRSVMKQLIPERIATAVKQGFSAPDASWFRGESIEYVNDRLLTPTAKIYDLFDYKTTASLVNSHLSGRQNRRLLLWSLLYLEEWMEQFMTAGQGGLRSTSSDTSAAAGAAT